MLTGSHEGDATRPGRLAGKMGLITASGSGMGRAGAIRFALEGASVAVVDLRADAASSVAEEITAAGGKAIAISGDLQDPAFAEDIVTRVIDSLGALDFLWNHVGIPGPASVEGLDPNDYHRALDINLTSSLITTTSALPHLRERGGGSILFTSSTSAILGSPLSPVYSATKFAQIGLMKSLAKRYGPDGIRFNAIAPGSIDTPMLREFFARSDDASRTAADVEQRISARASAYPLNRIGTPEDVANAALFLLSDEAAFITGAVLVVDGGLTA